MSRLESPSSVSSSQSPPKLNHPPSTSTQFDHPIQNQILPPNSSSTLPQTSSSLPQKIITKSNHDHPNPSPSSSPSSPSSPSSSSSDPPQSIPPSKITPKDLTRLHQWSSKDQIYQHTSVQAQIQKRTNVFGEIYSQALDDSQLDWLGEINSNRPPTRFRLQMPIELDATLASGKRKHRPRLHFTKKDLKLIANTEEVLVPIRLEIEIEHWKLRDTFTWNLREPVVTPEQFAIHLCEDLILPIQHFSAPIVTSIKEQLEEYKLHENFQNHLTIPLNAQENQANLNQDVKLGVSHTSNLAEPPSLTHPQTHNQESWWNHWKQKIFSLDDHLTDHESKEPKRHSKRVKRESPKLTQSSINSRLIDSVDENFKPVPLDSISISSLEMRDDELRIPIILDIISGSIHLTDRFEWEISQIDNSPEQFAEVYANDLGLSGEFKTAIAHSIREQIEIYVKSLALVEHTNGYPVPNDELRYAFLQRVTDPIRTGQVSEFTPFLNLLNAEELDRQEKEHDREARRKRRQTRGRRGITLPDRESQRTVRNIVPIQGIDMVIPYQNDNEELVVPVQPFAQPYAIKESVVELADSSEHQPKRHIQANKEVLVPDTQLGTPSKPTGSRASRRLRGATADVVAGSTPPKTNDMNGGDKEDALTPSNTGTPAVTQQTTNKKSSKTDSSTNANINSSSKKPPPAPQTRGRINWEALGLHDPMINGVWHCSNCGCPEHVAVGRRKGLGGKDTLCGDCGRYIHRYKKNRPIMYNTSAEYHTSLKLEADKAKQAIADQEVIRKEKNKAENQNLPTNSNSKKRKKDSRNSLLPMSDKLRRTEDRSASVASSTKSGQSEDSSPVVSTRSTNNGSSEKVSSKKRSRIIESSDAPPPTTRAQRSLSKNIVLDSPEVGNSPESNSPNNTRSQSTSGSLATKTLRTSSRRGSMKPDQAPGKKGTVKTEEEIDQDVKPGQAVEPRQQAPKTKEPRTKNQEKVRSGTKSPDETTQATSQLPTGSRSGSISGPSNASLSKDSKSEPRRSLVNGRLPSVVSTARRFEPPHWMVGALLNIKNSYPSDRVELISKAKKEPQASGQPPVVVGCDWRLKCLDCPGKLYTVGPGESFTNFDVHLKNRQHRQKVDERLIAAGLPPSISSHQISPTTSTHQPSGISSTRSSQQLTQAVSQVLSTSGGSQSQVSSTHGSQQNQISLSQPQVSTPSQQPVPGTTNSSKNQGNANLEQTQTSSMSSLYQTQVSPTEVSKQSQISPTTAVIAHRQPPEVSLAGNSNHQRMEGSSSLPSHANFNDPQTHRSSFSEGVQVQNHSHELNQNLNHDSRGSLQLNPPPQLGLTISSQHLSPEVSREGSQSFTPVTETTNLDGVGMGGGRPERSIGFSGNNHTVSDVAHSYPPSSALGVNHEAQMMTGEASMTTNQVPITRPPSSRTTSTHEINRTSPSMMSYNNNNFNPSIQPNRSSGDSASLSHSPSENNLMMNMNYHLNQNVNSSHEYFQPNQTLNPSENNNHGGIRLSSPNFQTCSNLMNINQIDPGNGNNSCNENGQNLPPPSSSNNNNSMNPSSTINPTTNTSYPSSLPSLLHPPLPHTLVHPLPKKPSFD